MPESEYSSSRIRRLIVPGLLPEAGYVWKEVRGNNHDGTAAQRGVRAQPGGHDGEEAQRTGTFQRGLKEWKHLLKAGGFMVVHDEQGNIEEKLTQISDCGYELLGHFALSKETWWKEYFGPLEEWIAKVEAGYIAGPKLLEELKQARIELDMFKEFPERNSSIYFVMKKCSAEE